MIKKLKNILKSFIKEEKHESEEEPIFCIIDVDDWVKEYNIPLEYIDETLYVIKIFKGNTLIDITDYSESKVERLSKMYPVLYNVNVEPRARYIIYESIHKINE